MNKPVKILNPKYSIILLLCATLYPCRAQSAEDLPVVGLDKNHQEQALAVPAERYAKTFHDILSTVHDSTVPALESQEAQHSAWMLRNVIVGIGLSLSVGLGPIYSLEAASRVRVGFSNSTHPKFLSF